MGVASAIRCAGLALGLSIAALGAAAAACSSGHSDEGSPDAMSQEAAADVAPDRAAAMGDVIARAVAGPMSTQGAVGMAIGAVDGDASVLAFFGEATLDGGAPPNASTLFQIGSNTKCFTATLLAHSVSGGQTSLSDELTSDLPAAYAFPPASEKSKITLEELADHTSGLPRNPDDVANGATTYSVDMLYADGDSIAVASDAGTTFLYSNMGYALLGYALANHAGQSWDSLVRQVITAPLGMTDTDLYAQLDAGQRARVAQGTAPTTATCAKPPCPVPPTTLLATFPGPGLDPAGGLFSTPTDMMTWLRWNMGATDQPSLSPLLPMLRGPLVDAGTNQQVGLAWNTSTLAVGGAAQAEIWKDGDTAGFHSFVGYVASAGRGVFVLTNFQPSVTPRAIGEQILADMP